MSELNGKLYSEIHLIDSTDCLYFYNENFVIDCESEDHTIVIFEIPSNYYEDVERFSKGEYSKFSQSARNAILSNSGLIWRQTYMGDDENLKGKIVSHVWLQAISKDPKDRLSARRRLEEQIGYSLEDVNEYISKPNESEFKQFHPENRAF